MLNRAAIIVRPADPYMAWAKSLDDSDIVPNPAGEQTVYLVPEFEDDDDDHAALLRLIYAEIFERELHGWHTAEADWPQNRSLRMFKEWFHIEVHTVVEDLCADPIEDDDLDNISSGDE